MSKSEGAAVRQAFDGPDIDYDRLIAFILDRNREDKERASDAGESRQKIGSFIEDTGLNGKALSIGRMIIKILDKKEGELKAMDIIGSLELILPMVKDYVVNAGTKPMDLPEPGESAGGTHVVPFN